MTRCTTSSNTTRRSTRRWGIRFAVILPPDHQLAQLPQLVGLHRLLNVHESVDDALEPWPDETEELPTGV